MSSGTLKHTEQAIDGDLSEVNAAVGNAPLWKHFGLAAVVFAAVFLLCLWQNPSSVAPRTTLYFDGGHYLDSCKQISLALHDWFAGLANKTTAESVAFYLLLDGPILPLAGAVAFSIQGKAPDPADWFVLVQMQCFLQAVAAVAIYHLSSLLTGRRYVGVAAGLCWGLYPATISSCGLFLTEPMACVLVLLTVLSLNFSTVKDCTFNLQGFASKLMTGAVLATLALLKTALIPAIALVSVLAVICAKSKKRAVSALCVTLVGSALVVAPWALFTYYANGAVTLFPSRKPVYNIATGMNLEADGWGCYPTHAVTSMFSDFESGAAVAAGLFSAEPEKMTNLYLRKVNRLWAFPWNDFRYRILGLSFKLQTLLQNLLVLLGTAGMLFYGARVLSVSETDRTKRFLILSSIAFIACHLVYLPFEGIARYGFTAMPFFVMLAVCVSCEALKQRPARFALWVLTIAAASFAFHCDLLPLTSMVFNSTEQALLGGGLVKLAALAALGLSTYHALSKLGQPSDTATSAFWLRGLTVSLTAIGAAILFAFTYADREPRQWQASLRPGISAVKQFTLTGSPAPSWVLLVIDGDEELASARLAINGALVDGRLESLYQYYGAKYELQNYIGMFASLVRQSPQKLRQWRAVQVPTGLLKLDGQNEIVITAADRKVTVFGDYVRDGDRSLLLPSFEQISPGKLFNGTDEYLDCRLMEAVGSRTGSSTCYLLDSSGKRNERDLSAKPGVQNGQYRIFLLAGYKHASSRVGDSAAARTEQVKDSELAIRNATIPAPVVVEPRVKDFLPEYPAQVVDDKAQAVLLRGEDRSAWFELNPEQRASRVRIPVPKDLLHLTHLRVKISGVVASTRPGSLAVAGILETGDKEDLTTILPGCPALVSSTSKVEPFSISCDVPVSVVAGSRPAVLVELNSVIPGAQKDARVACGKLKVELSPVEKANLSGHSLKFF